MADRLADSLSQVEPIEAWHPAAPDLWSRKWAGHLYRRAGFGATPDELRRAEQAGLSATLDRLLNGEPQAAKHDPLIEETGRSLARKGDADGLRSWWLYFMLYGGHALREKLTLSWHNHFATSIAKVGRNDLMLRQNLLLRKHALGKFGALLRSIGRDPAMLIWLDSNQNVKGRPNENYAREVMELFSLGVGNYTETDIREAARAFTGWQGNLTGDESEFQPQSHDADPKTVLKQTGNWDGDDVARILLEQPACARFLVRKLYRFFISETDPPAALLEPLAERFRHTDYDVADLVKAMLGSRLFFSQHAYRQRIKSPVELVLGMVRSVLPGPVVPGLLVPSLEAMGQQLFAPPNVKGWPGGRLWLNDATLLARHNFAEHVAMGIATEQARLAPGQLTSGQFDAGAFAADSARKKPAVAPELKPSLDAVTLIRESKAFAPAEIVAKLSEHLLDGEVAPHVRAKLEQFVSAGKPVGKELDHRIRETAHAMMCLPEYQLA